MVAIGPVVSEEKSFEIVDGRTTDGRRTTEPAYTISSPGAFGSGELKTCVHSRGHNLAQKFMKLCQNVNSHKLGHNGSKTKSLGDIMKKPCVHSRGYSFDQKFMKLCQNVNFHKI